MERFENENLDMFGMSNVAMSKKKKELINIYQNIKRFKFLTRRFNFPQRIKVLEMYHVLIHRVQVKTTKMS